MPAFAKSPRFILGALVVLWVGYLLYANFQLKPIQIRLIPFLATLEFNVSAVIIGSALFGCVATIVVQWLWRRRSSKNGSTSAAPSASSSNTAA